MDKKTGGVSDGDDTCQGCGAALESDGAERDEFLQSRENAYPQKEVIGAHWYGHCTIRTEKEKEDAAKRKIHTRTSA